MQQKEAIDRFNQYAAQGQPFVFVIDYALADIRILPLSQAAHRGIYYDIQGITNYTFVKKPLPKPVAFAKMSISREVYQRAFDTVQAGLQRGDSFLCNLTFPTPIETNLTLQQIFEHSQAKYKLWFEDKFVVFSPESFVRIDADGTISSFPMKGTIDAQLPDAAQLILENPKERAEHNTIVDFIRNDLSRVAKKVEVVRFRYVERIKTMRKDLLQVSSEIKGKLPDDWKNHLGNIFFALLPAGSISGAPKPSTLRIIDDAEHEKRGFYTGVVGVFDGQKLDSGVMIRFIEQDQKGNKTFRSGGGITVFSDSDAEYQELIDKVYVPIFREHSVRNTVDAHAAAAVS